jgi:hypothetical protein
LALSVGRHRHLRAAALAIGRNPDGRRIRGIAIILAAFAEGLDVSRSSSVYSRSSSSRPGSWISAAMRRAVTPRLARG